MKRGGEYSLKGTRGLWERGEKKRKKRLKGEKRERSRDNEERQTKTETKRGELKQRANMIGGRNKLTNKRDERDTAGVLACNWDLGVHVLIFFFFYARRRQIAALSERLSWDQTPREMRGRLEQPWHQTWQEPWVCEIPDSHTGPGSVCRLFYFSSSVHRSDGPLSFLLRQKDEMAPSFLSSHSLLVVNSDEVFVVHAQSDRRDRLCFIMKQISCSLNIPSYSAVSVLSAVQRAS